MDAGPACGSVTYIGCCSQQSVVYCAGGALKTIVCSGGQQCGWSTVYGMYLCGATADADPTGKYPRMCKADLGVPLPDTSTNPNDGSADGCGPLTYSGCCAGSKLHFCVGSQVMTLDCTTQPSCGWNSKGQYYDCATAGSADPSGTHPMSCAAVLQDANISLDAALDMAVDVAVEMDFHGDLDAAPLDAWVLSDGPPRDLKQAADAGSADGMTGLDASGLDVSGLDRSFVQPSGGGGCGSCGVGSAQPPPLGLVLLLTPLVMLRLGRGWVVLLLLVIGCGDAAPRVGRLQRAVGGEGVADLALDGVADLAPDVVPDVDAGGVFDGVAPSCGLVTSTGCCAAQTLWWCEAGTLKQLDCSGKPECGWSNSGFYDCNTSGASDPSGATSIDCSGLLPDAGPSDVGPDATAGPCGTIGLEGCCDGDTLKYCEDGELRSVSCALNPTCGWFPMGQYYDCGTDGGFDPLGGYPRACPGSVPSDAVSDLFPSPDVVDATVDAGDVAGGGGCGCSLVWRAPLRTPGRLPRSAHSLERGAEPPGMLSLLLILGLVLAGRRS